MHMDPKEVEAQRLRLELRLALLDRRERSKASFLDFARYAWPEAIFSAHHSKMANAFDRIISGDLKRLIINMPPRHTKSEFASYLLPAYAMGRKPDLKIIQATHTGELAVRFGRKVRNLMDTQNYKDLFEGVELQADSKAAGRWETSKGGEYFAVGVGGAMTGRGADLLIIDDPHSEQDAMSTLALDNAWEWYSAGPRSRLQPGAAVVVIMCMTGETGVLRPDGSQTLLRDIRPGDLVATFDHGELSVSKVNNWKSNGCDSIYQVTTQSGRILRANERHPFLVDANGEKSWVRLKDLKTGDMLVSLKDAAGPHGHRQGGVGCAARAPRLRATTRSTPPRLALLLGITASGRGRHAVRTGVAILRTVEAYAKRITVGSTSRKERRKILAGTGSSTGTASLRTSIMRWLRSVATGVTYAASFPRQATLAHTGTASCALTTATTQAKYEDCSATTATSQSDMERRQMYLSELQRISDFTTDPIVSILPDGEEEVFDVEIDRTENFIANGIVSHNTRWGTKDLTARLIKSQNTFGSDKWEVIEFPAIFNEHTPDEKPLWPSFWKLGDLQAVRASLSVQRWNAMYQQRPTSDEGAILKREWWRTWEREQLPAIEYIIQSYDTAYSKKETADFSVITTWGVFYPTEDSGPNIILMDMRKGRWDFPDLKRVAKDQYAYWQPDNVLIEAKATGVTLQQELRRMGIPVTMYTPGGRRAGQDKVSRANAVAPRFESGMVWAPNTQWAQEVIEECASFPNGDNDDLVDSTTQALMRFRAGNFISLQTDEDDESSDEALVPEYY